VTQDRKMLKLFMNEISDQKSYAGFRKSVKLN
jgi:hypothetical protein